MVMLRPSIIVAALLGPNCNAFTPPSPRSQSSRAPFPPLCATSSKIETRTKTKDLDQPGFVSDISEQKSELDALDKNSAKKERYVPKWKKSATLAETSGTGGLSIKEKGLAGSVPIKFQTGKGEKATFVETAAMPGQPLKLVASQAGQYIKYGCGRGECGTCESLCNGQYLRPCVDAVPTDLQPDAATGEYAPLVIQVKGTRAKVVSSGKFYSAKSFLMGFWNNFLGMGGFVRDRRKAKKNWQERMAKEDDIRRLTEEKKRRRLAEAALK